MSDAFGSLDAPADPREAWSLPAFGQLPVEEDLDETVTRVIAPNASPMTLDGTNTYVVAAAGSGEAVVVDPGPEDGEHRARVDAVLSRRDVACVLVAVTHHHRDHSAAAQRWADDFGCAVAAPTADVAGRDGVVVQDRESIGPPSMRLEVVATPGHSLDHTSYRLPHGPVLTGDHVLGRGTSVVAYPDGDLVAYLDSLRRLLDLGPDVLYPGHGPALTQDAQAVIDFYLEHRRFREAQVVAALHDGPADAATLVRRIYADVDAVLWPAAERSTRATLDKLARERRVVLADDGRARLVS